jgi:hypothetical protein
MQVTQSLVLDIASGEILQHEHFDDAGQASQAPFYETLTGQYKTIFGQSQDISRILCL